MLFGVTLPTQVGRDNSDSAIIRICFWNGRFWLGLPALNRKFQCFISSDSDTFAAKSGLSHTFYSFMVAFLGHLCHVWAFSGVIEAIAAPKAQIVAQLTNISAKTKKHWLYGDARKL